MPFLLTVLVGGAPAGNGLLRGGWDENKRGRICSPAYFDPCTTLGHLEDHHAGIDALNEQQDPVAALVLGEELFQLTRG
jgi:hypothetical protein